MKYVAARHQHSRGCAAHELQAVQPAPASRGSSPSAAGDMPTSKLFVREYFHQFYRLGMSYEYTLDDLLGAQFRVAKTAARR